MKIACGLGAWRNLQSGMRAIVALVFVSMLAGEAVAQAPPAQTYTPDELSALGEREAEARRTGRKADALYYFEAGWPQRQYNLRFTPALRAKYRLNYALMLLDSRRAEQAEREARIAISELDQVRNVRLGYASEYVRAPLVLSWARESRGDTAGAIVAAEQGIREAAAQGILLDPQDDMLGFTRFQLGRLLLQVGRSANAIEALKPNVAAEMRCRVFYRESVTTTRMAYERMGDRANAVRMAQMEAAPACAPR